MFKVVPRYEQHLWYPIVVRYGTTSRCKIVEMQGKQVNDYNDWVREHNAQFKKYPLGGEYEQTNY